MNNQIHSNYSENKSDSSHIARVGMLHKTARDRSRQGQDRTDLLVRLVMMMVVVVVGMVSRIRIVLGGMRPDFGRRVASRRSDRTVQVMRTDSAPLAGVVQVQIQTAATATNTIL